MGLISCAQGVLEYELTHNPGGVLQEINIVSFKGRSRPKILVTRISNGRTELPEQALDRTKDLRTKGLKRDAGRQTGRIIPVPDYRIRLLWQT